MAKRSVSKTRKRSSISFSLNGYSGRSLILALFIALIMLPHSLSLCRSDIILFLFHCIDDSFGIILLKSVYVCGVRCVYSFAHKAQSIRIKYGFVLPFGKANVTQPSHLYTMCNSSRVNVDTE